MVGLDVGWVGLVRVILRPDMGRDYDFGTPFKSSWRGFWSGRRYRGGGAVPGVGWGIDRSEGGLCGLMMGEFLSAVYCSWCIVSDSRL